MRIYPTKRQLAYLEEIGVFQSEADRRQLIQNRRTLRATNKRSFVELAGSYIRNRLLILAIEFVAFIVLLRLIA